MVEECRKQPSLQDLLRFIDENPDVPGGRNGPGCWRAFLSILATNYPLYNIMPRDFLKLRPQQRGSLFMELASQTGPLSFETISLLKYNFPALGNMLATAAQAAWMSQGMPGPLRDVCRNIDTMARGPLIPDEVFAPLNEEGNDHESVVTFVGSSIGTVPYRKLPKCYPVDSRGEKKADDVPDEVLGCTKKSSIHSRLAFFVLPVYMGFVWVSN
jgi:hypothetical protein